MAATGPYWPFILIAVIGVIIFIGLGVWILRALTRRRRLRESLVTATLHPGPKPRWLELGIVMRNSQPNALTVRSLIIVDPPGSTVCELWSAWQSSGAGVKFVAPRLELTNSVPVGRTILPDELAYYGAFRRGRLPRRHDTELQNEDEAGPLTELTRRFYVRPPEGAPHPIVLRATLMCELQTQKVRRMQLTFSRVLR